MTEFGNKDSEREIARLRKQNGSKSPVNENVLKFEGKSGNSDIPGSRNARREERNARLQNQSLNLTRSKSPGMKNERPNQLFSPTRSKSPGMSSELSPTWGKSPGSRKNLSDEFSSPTGSKSPGTSSELSPTRGKSPGSRKSLSDELSSPTGSKSPAIVTERITKSYSAPSTTSPGGYSKWTRNEDKTWKEESPDSSKELTDIMVSEPKPNSDEVDISWILDNIEFVATPEKDRVTLNASPLSEEDDGSQAERDESGGEEKLVEEKERFHNALNYNMAAWDKNDSSPEDNMLKKADEFIQRLCDQVRNHVEYLCGVNFISYKAISYKVRVAGAEGIYYYIKVNVWQNCCVHLRIFNQKNELRATPALQAILERAQTDKGNIEFF